MRPSSIRSALLPLAVILVPAAVPARGDAPSAVPLGPGSVLAFATEEEGAALLGAEDDYTRRTSPFDRQSRLRAAGPVSDAEHRAFAARSVLPWTDGEREAIAAAAAGLDTRFAEIGVPLPPRVVLVKTTGDEEGGAAYTRGTTVVLPRRMLGGGEASRRLLCHELFHVVSRNAPRLRRDLYASIGFEPCGDVVLPGDLESLRLTNPDAPIFDHCIRVTCDGGPRWMVPVLYASGPYDAKGGKPFFASMVFRLMAVERGEGPGGEPHAVATLDGAGRPVLRSPEEVQGFFEQTGRNTSYLIHPEEILADNFVHLAVGGGKDASPLPTPGVVERMGVILRSHAAAVGDLAPSGE